MGTILGSWSGMRKYLEKEMLAENLQGRVRYNCTTYPNMDGCHIFEIFVDNKLVKQFSWETVNSYLMNKGLSGESYRKGSRGYWEDFWKLMDEVPLENRTEYTDGEFCDALERYRNQEIQASLNSENPLVRMFAVLDRRVGKRTLEKIKENVVNQPEWLQFFYRLRLEK